MSRWLEGNKSVLCPGCETADPHALCTRSTARPVFFFFFFVSKVPDRLSKHTELCLGCLWLSHSTAIPEHGYPHSTRRPEHGYPTARLSHSTAIPQHTTPRARLSHSTAIPQHGYPTARLSHSTGYPTARLSHSTAIPQYGYPTQHTTPTAFEVTPAGRLAGRRWLIEGPVSSSGVLSVTAVGCV